MNIVGLYTIIDDFFKSIQHEEVWKLVSKSFNGKRGPKPKLSLPEVVTLNIIRFYTRSIDLKSFHKLVLDRYQDEFPNMPNYENFLKATNKSFTAMILFLQFLLFLGRQKCRTGIHFIDSTSLQICKNYNIYRNKVGEGLASRGRSTKGWFFGFKLHGVCNDEGFLEDIMFSPGSPNDKNFLEPMSRKIHGTLVGDAGYLVKEEVFKRVLDSVGRLFIATRKNMKRVMTKEQSILFKKRSKIETIWGILKERFLLETNLPRSITGFFRHYIYSISAWCFKSLFKEKLLLV
ncbi:MAG: IS982 family transposase [Spirochaetales bacterium]|nr:IS982 family transposase [Spirochaetales bacterium]